MVGVYRIISCLDHAVLIVDRRGNPILQIPAGKDEHFARLIDEVAPGEMTTPISVNFRPGVPIHTVFYRSSRIERLPEPQPGVIYLVARHVFDHPSCAHRLDLARPGQVVKLHGHKVGTLGLVFRDPPAAPAASVELEESIEIQRIEEIPPPIRPWMPRTSELTIAVFRAIEAAGSSGISTGDLRNTFQKGEVTRRSVLNALNTLHRSGRIRAGDRPRPVDGRPARRCRRHPGHLDR